MSRVAPGTQENLSRPRLDEQIGRAWGRCGGGALRYQAAYLLLPDREDQHGEAQHASLPREVCPCPPLPRGSAGLRTEPVNPKRHISLTAPAPRDHLNNIEPATLQWATAPRSASYCVGVTRSQRGLCCICYVQRSHTWEGEHANGRAGGSSCQHLPWSMGRWGGVGGMMTGKVCRSKEEQFLPRLGCR